MEELIARRAEVAALTARIRILQAEKNNNIADIAPVTDVPEEP